MHKWRRAALVCNGKAALRPLCTWGGSASVACMSLCWGTRIFNVGLGWGAGNRLKGGRLAPFSPQRRALTLTLKAFPYSNAMPIRISNRRPPKPTSQSPITALYLL